MQMHGMLSLCMHSIDTYSTLHRRPQRQSGIFVNSQNWTIRFFSLGELIAAETRETLWWQCRWIYNYTIDVCECLSNPTRDASKLQTNVVPYFVTDGQNAHATRFEP